MDPYRTHAERNAHLRGLLRSLLALAVIAAGLVALGPSGAQATPATDGNPDLAASCGLDVTLVLDDSGSINATEAQRVRNSAQAFATALVGTPSRLKTVVFSTRAEGVAANGTLTPDLNQIVFRDPASYTAPTSGAGQGQTNWDDALEVARRSNGGPGDLVVFITDGDPTEHNVVTPDGHLNNGSHAVSSVGPANLNNAIVESELLHPSGTHLFGIGVGLTTSAQESRLRAVTGDEEMTITGGVPTPSFGQADYIITNNFDELEEVVAAFVRELCGHSLNVTKYLQTADGNVVRADASTPWEFTASFDAEEAPDTWQNPPIAPGSLAGWLTSNGNGGVSFVWDQGSDDHDHVATLTETPQTGWVYNGAVCSVNDFSGAPPTVLFDTVGANTPGSAGDIADLAALPIESNKAVNCNVYNREVRTSNISVAKVTSPANMAGDFDFTLSSGGSTVGTVNDLSHGQSGSFGAVNPGTYAITETSPSGFDLTSAVCDNLATATVVESEPASGLVVGEGQNWRCTFTNTAQDGSITVVKNTTGANGTFDFTSDIPGLGNFSLTTTGTGSGGTASTATVPVPVGHYDVLEVTPAGWTLTGASCDDGSSPTDIVVDPGEDVICTFENTADLPSIRVVKTAGTSSVLELGGPVTFTVDVINTSVEPVTVTSLTDSIDGGPELDLVVTGGPITATSCDALVGSTLPVGGSGSCTFTVEVSGLGETTELDVVTATAEDSDGTEATASDDAMVAIVGVLPAIAVTKTPSVPAISEPGGPVTYTVAITNTGLEPVVIEALTDSVEGGPAVDIAQVAGAVTATTCDDLVGDSLGVGATASCTFTYVHTGHTADHPDGFIDDTVTVTGSDDDGSVTASADARVAILDVAPTVEVTKVANPTSVPETAPGQTRTVTYTVTVTNTSVEDVEITSIVDSVEGAPAVPVGGTCAALVGVTLAPDQTRTCEFTGQVSGEAGDVVHDTVTATVVDDEDNSASDRATAEVTFTDVPSSIQVTKTANPTSVAENGGPVTFSVTIRNTSPTDSVTIGSITDSVDGATPFPVASASCAALIGTSLAPGAQADCTFVLDVTGNAGDVVVDVVVVQATDDDGASVSDDDDASVTITDLPSSIAVEKSADVTSLPEPGGTVTYTVQITNTSVADSITIGSIVDSVNGGPAAPVAGTCAALIGTVLVPNQTVTCTFTADVGEHTGDVTRDTVTVSGTDDDGRPVSASGSETVTITDVASSLSVDKQASVASVPEPGGPVTFTVTITNTSLVDTVTIDAITDSVDGGPALPVGGDCAALIDTVLDPGRSVECSFTVDVTGDAGDVVHDTVVVSGTDDEGLPVSAEDSEDVDITNVAPTLEVTKSASPSSVPETGPGETRQITYTVTIVNTSPEVVTITSIVDSVDGGPAVPVGGDCALLVGTTLDPQESTVCTFEMDVSGDAGDVITDVVTVTVSDNEQGTASDSDDASVTFTDVGSSLLVTKTANPASIPEPGGPVTFTVDITNTSPADSITIDAIVDSVDGGTAFPLTGECALLVGTVLPVGGSVSCTFTLDVVGNAGDVVPDTVTVTGTDDDDNPVEDSADESVEITDVASSLAVTKTADVDSVPEPGGPVTYTVEITNTSAADQVTIDAITDSVDGAPAVDVGGTCAALIGTVLDPGQSVSCSFEMEVTGNAGDVVTDTVTVTGTDDDDNPVEDSATEVVDVDDVLPTGTVTKTGSPTSLPESGGTVTYTVVVTNTSVAEAATLTVITDEIDGEVYDVTVVDGPITATTCSTGNVLAPGESYECTFDVAVPPGTAGDVVTDTVTATLVDDEDNETEPSDNEEVPLTDVAPTIEVVKDNNPQTLAAPGGPVEFHVSVANTSFEAVTVTSLVDSVDGGAPFDVTVVAGPITDTTCSTGVEIPAGGTYLCRFTMVVSSDEPAVVPDEVLATVVDDDGTEATDADTAITEVTASADLAVTKRLVGEGLFAGQQGTYEVVVTNEGPSTAVGPVVVDTLPVGVTPSTAVGEGWICSLDGQVVTCERSTLAPGESSVVTIGVAVDAGIGGESVTNVAEVDSETEDPDRTNNRTELTNEIDRPEPPPGPTLAPPVEPGPTGQLPRTGADVLRGVLVGLVLVAAGGAVLALRRRARPTTTF